MSEHIAKLTLGLIYSVKNAASRAPQIPPIEIKKKLKLLRLEEPFLGSRLDYYTMSASTITLINAPFNWIMAKKVTIMYLFII